MFTLCFNLCCTETLWLTSLEIFVILCKTPTPILLVMKKGVSYMKLKLFKEESVR